MWFIYAQDTALFFGWVDDQGTAWVDIVDLNANYSWAYLTSGKMLLTIDDWGDFGLNKQLKDWIKLWVDVPSGSSIAIKYLKQDWSVTDYTTITWPHTGKFEDNIASWDFHEIGWIMEITSDWVNTPKIYNFN